MKKKIIISLIIVVILGLIITLILSKKNQNKEKINIIDRLDANNNQITENTHENKVFVDPEEMYLYEDLEWINKENTDLSTYFGDLDYTKINRKDENKELIYEKKHKYIFQGADWEGIIPVINLDSDDAEKINLAIEKVMLDCYGIEYAFEIKGETLSLMLQEDHEERTVYTLYNINIYTGQIN